MAAAVNSRVVQRDAWGFHAQHGSGKARSFGWGSAALRPRIGLGLTGDRARAHSRANAFSIDRRQHLDIAYKRQEEREERALRLSGDLLANSVTEFDSLEQLDALLETAGTSLVVVFFYSKTCGICKEARGRFRELAEDAKRQKARVAFLQHNVLDEYDHASDVARFHKVKAVPCFLFLDEGAVVERVSLRDIRQMGGSKDMIQGAISDDLRRLKHTFWKVLLRCAPSARH